jgi:hypothetical protein
LIVGLGLLAVFVVCAALMYARLLPALLAVPLMALALTLIAGAGVGGAVNVVVDGTVKLAPVIVTTIFGALLSRVTLSTGIAETIVDYAAEFGGDRPLLLALALCAAVALLFTSLTGLGAIIMVGSIVLPIMLTIGVPRRTAATLFMLAFALGFIFNISQWKFYTTTFGVDRAQLQPYAFALAGIDLVALLVYAAIRFRAERGYATWAIEAEEPITRRRVAPWALLTPVLPIALYFFAHLDPLVAFALAALFGVLATRPRAAVETLVAAAIRGVEDVAPAVLLFMGIGMLLVATAQPAVRAALAPLVSAIAPRSPVAYVVLFGLLSPLALYRGPLNPFGVGIAVYTVLAGLGIMPAAILVAAVMAVVQVQNVCDPTNTQNVWVANFTGVGVTDITKLTLPFQVAVATVAVTLVALFGTPLLGTPPFAEPKAAAATLDPTPPPGLFAPASSAHTIAVAAPDDDASKLAADTLARQIASSWKTFHAMRLQTIPESTGCTETPYAALAVVTVQFYAQPGTPNGMDVGIELRDCAGWPVDQWHEQADDKRPNAGTAVQTEALAALFRVKTWMQYHPAEAEALFTTGLAHTRDDEPTYFYTLFKTIDGQMRAYVRPGGPAYAAGLRTNDVVEKVDGKEWWQYGTYQTQAKAYDGKPHTFEVTRGKEKQTITLRQPYAPQ